MEECEVRRRVTTTFGRLFKKLFQLSKKFPHKHKKRDIIAKPIKTDRGTVVSSLHLDVDYPRESASPIDTASLNHASLYKMCVSCDK